MRIDVRGHQMDVGDALTSHVRDALAAASEKYFPEPIEAQVVFEKSAHMVRCGITAHPTKGFTVRGEAEAAQAYAAFDEAAEKIDKRLRRHKRRLVDHHKRSNGTAPMDAAYYVLSGDEPEAQEPETEEAAETPLVVAEMRTEISDLTVGEAVMRLDLGELPAMLFRNRAHGRLNLVYRRPDGHVSWVDPQEG